MPWRCTPALQEQQRMCIWATKRTNDTNLEAGVVAHLPLRLEGELLRPAHQHVSHVSAADHVGGMCRQQQAAGPHSHGRPDHLACMMQAARMASGQMASSRVMIRLLTAARWGWPSS